MPDLEFPLCIVIGYVHFHGDELVNHDESICDHLATLEAQHRTKAPQGGPKVRLGHRHQTEEAPERWWQRGHLVLFRCLRHEHSEVGVQRDLMALVGLTHIVVIV